MTATGPVDRRPRLATPEDADAVAELLHAFNEEYEVPTPGVDVLRERLVELLGGNATFAVLAGSPPVGLALVTLRSNVWYQGPVALLDELYVVPQLRGRGIGSSLVAEVVGRARQLAVELVEINVDEGDVDAQRFYVRHGFRAVDPDSGERALYFSQELDGT